MATPFQGLIAQLKALKGAPRVTYPEGDAAFPMTERYLILKRGQHLPTFGQAEPDAGRFPNNKLGEHVELESDAQFVHCYRKYEILPGKVTPGASTYDRESEVFMTSTRQKKPLADITPGLAREEGANLYVTITEKDPINSYYGYEVVTTIPEATAKDLASAIVEDEMLPHEFPGRIDIDLLDLHGIAIGFKKPFVATALLTTKTYWVIAATKPSLAYDEIEPNTIWINSQRYDAVLHDETTREYAGGFVTIDATTPDYTTFMGSWVGTARVIRGGVFKAGHRFRWKVKSISVVMR